jgi:hypothetical protein
MKYFQPPEKEGVVQWDGQRFVGQINGTICSNCKLFETALQGLLRQTACHGGRRRCSVTPQLCVVWYGACHWLSHNQKKFYACVHGSDPLRHL